MFRVRIDSMVDVITNSSSVIYTYQDQSISALKDLLQSIIDTFDIKESIDDMFYIGTFCEDYYYLDSDNCPKNITDKNLSTLMESILKGTADKPQWMIDIEEDDSYDYPPDLDLVLLEKDAKYKKLGQRLLSFLNSPSHESSYNG